VRFSFLVVWLGGALVGVQRAGGEGGDGEQQQGEEAGAARVDAGADGERDRLSDGTRRFEFTAKVKGRVVKRTLAATSARQALREIENVKPVARQGGIGQGSTRLGDLLDSFLREAEAGTYFLESGRYAASTVSLYRQQLSDHVRDQLGESRRVRDLTQGDMQALVDRLRAKGLSGSTCRSVVSAISAAFTYGRRRGLVQADPTGDLLMPSAKRQSEPRYLSRAEADALLAALTKKTRPVAATMLFSGLRVSEALGLTWGDIEVLEGTLRVHRQLGRDGVSFAPLKTASSEAVPSIPEPLLAVLREHRSRQAALAFERVGADQLVFVTRSGRSPGRNNVARAIRNARPEPRLRDGRSARLPTLVRLDAALARVHVRADRALSATRFRPHD
jgi:site-specific recombinase XerD